MRRDVVTAAFLVLAVAGPFANGAQLGAPASVTAPAYDDFMRLGAEERRQRFDAMTAEHRAIIVRTHAQGWLQRNRERLTASEVAIFEEIIAFLTDLYERPDAASDRREKALMTNMRCRVSPEDVREATRVLEDESIPAAAKPRWTYMRQARCWLYWVVEGLVDFIPSPDAWPIQHAAATESTASCAVVRA